MLGDNVIVSASIIYNLCPSFDRSVGKMHDAKIRQFRARTVSKPTVGPLPAVDIVPGWPTLGDGLSTHAGGRAGSNFTIHITIHSNAIHIRISLTQNIKLVVMYQLRSCTTPLGL